MYFKPDYFKKYNAEIVETKLVPDNHKVFYHGLFNTAKKAF